MRKITAALQTTVADYVGIRSVGTEQAKHLTDGDSK